MSCPNFPVCPLFWGPPTGDPKGAQRLAVALRQKLRLAQQLTASLKPRRAGKKDIRTWNTTLPQKMEADDRKVLKDCFLSRNSCCPLPKEGKTATPPTSDLGKQPEMGQSRNPPKIQAVPEALVQRKPWVRIFVVVVACGDGMFKPSAAILNWARIEKAWHEKRTTQEISLIKTSKRKLISSSWVTKHGARTGDWNTELHASQPTTHAFGYSSLRLACRSFLASHLRVADVGSRATRRAIPKPSRDPNTLKQ